MERDVIPESYDGSAPYALRIALPDREGLYFQGVGEDLRWERVSHESRNYIEDMTTVSPQMNDWGETSARMAVRLTDSYRSEPVNVLLPAVDGKYSTYAENNIQRDELRHDAGRHRHIQRRGGA